MLKLLCKIKKNFCLRRDTNLTSLGKLLQSYFVTITRMLTNISLMKFQVRYLALFLLFSVIEGFEWFWMGSLHKNIQLMLEFLKAPFLVLHFSYYILMTFLMMLSVILPSMLKILLNSMCDRHLICVSNLNRLLNLNVIYETLDWG